MTDRALASAAVTLLAAASLLLVAGLLGPFGAAAPASGAYADLAESIGAPAPEPSGDASGLAALRPSGGTGGAFPSLSSLPSLPFSLGGGGGGDLAPRSSASGSGGGAAPGGSSGSGGLMGGIADGAAGLFDAVLGGGGGGDGPASDGRELNCRHRTTDGDVTLCVVAEHDLYPGTPAAVLVLRDGQPVPGVQVTVDGAPAGRTDDAGVVQVTVPYAEEFTVGVQQGGSARRGRYAAVAGPVATDLSAPTASDVRIAVAGDLDPGATVTVNAAFEGEDAPPLRSAAVTLDGERVATTDEHGNATVTLPHTDSSTLAVSRGDVGATAELELLRLGVDVSGDAPLGLAVPGSAGTVTVTDDGDPLDGVGVAIDGRSLGQTGSQGAVDGSLPLAPRAMITVETAGGATASETVFLYPVSTALAVLLLGGLAAAGVLVRRSEATGRGVLAEARAALASTADRLARLAVALGSGTVDVAGAVRARIERLTRRVVSLDPRAVDVDPAAAIRAQVDALRRWLRGTVSAGRRRASGVGRSRSERTAGEAASGPETPRERVREAWRTLVSRAAVRDTRTTTPGQVANRALDAGLPAGPVRRLTAAFRTVEYTDADPESPAEAAEAAAAELADDDGGESE